MRLFFLPILAAFLFSGCETSILSDDPATLDSRNINLRILHYWNSNLLNSDSIYAINGARFKIDEVKLLLSDFVFDNSGDSIPTEGGFTLTNQFGQYFKIGLLKPGSVSGYYHLKVGLDSATNLTNPGLWEEGHLLADEDLYNNKANSYNFITIKGRIFNPLKPGEIEPSIPLSYTVASQVLLTELSEQKSFSVPIGKDVVLDAVFDVSGLFEDIYPLTTPIIKSDPSNTADFDNAILLRDNFEESFELK